MTEAKHRNKGQLSHRPKPHSLRNVIVKPENNKSSTSRFIVSAPAIPVEAFQSSSFDWMKERISSRCKRLRATPRWLILSFSPVEKSDLREAISASSSAGVRLHLSCRPFFLIQHSSSSLLQRYRPNSRRPEQSSGSMLSLES
jgi:hypothetical protein